MKVGPYCTLILREHAFGPRETISSAVPTGKVKRKVKGKEPHPAPAAEIEPEFEVELDEAPQPSKPRIVPSLDQLKKNGELIPASALPAKVTAMVLNLDDKEPRDTVADGTAPITASIDNKPGPRKAQCPYCDHGLTDLGSRLRCDNKSCSQQGRIWFPNEVGL